MKLKFKVQPYQTRAVDAFADCFAGQPKSSGVSYRVDPGAKPVAPVAPQQIDLLGEKVVPVLRREFEALRPAHVPSSAPSHADLVAAGDRSPNAHVDPVAQRRESADMR